MHELVVQALYKARGDLKVLDGIDLHVDTGEIVAILGASGSGKTTLLRSVAGLDRPDAGRIEVGEQVVYDSPKVNLPSHKRGIGMVFQSYALWPHLSVRQNISYGLKIQKRSKKEIDDRVSELLDVVGLPQLADRYPSTLSGGQQQRVALARCLAAKPRLLLMDEPLSNLDLHVREQMREYLRDLVKRVGQTVVIVTHDADEAMALADRFYVLAKGKIIDTGTPTEVYAAPTHLETVKLLGAANVFRPETYDAAVGTCTLPGVSTSVTCRTANFEQSPEDQVSMMIWSEDVQLVKRDEASTNSGCPNNLTGQVLSSVLRGKGFWEYRVACGDVHIRALARNGEFSSGEEVSILLPPEKLVPILE